MIQMASNDRPSLFYDNAYFVAFEKQSKRHHRYLQFYSRPIYFLPFQIISGVAVRSFPSFGEEEREFVKDITDFGNILRAMIRKFGDSRNRKNSKEN